MTQVFLTVFNLSIAACWLIAAVLLVRLLFGKRMPKWICCCLWGLVAIRLLVPFTVESNISLVPNSRLEIMSEQASTDNLLQDQVIGIQQGSEVSTSVIPEYSQEQSAPAAENEFVADTSGVYIDTDSAAPIVSAPVIPTPENEPLTETTVAESAEERGLISKKTAGILGIVWAVGVAVMLVYWLTTYILLKKRVMLSIPCGDRVRKGECIESPFVFGLFRPRIYIPFGLSAQTEECVIAHERAHLKRRDHLVKPFGFFVLSIYWFNPLVWVAYILLCRDIEYACDEKVINDLPHEERKAYAYALLECAVAHKRISACPVAFGETGVKERVENTMKYKKPAFWLMLLSVFLCVMVAALFLTTSAGESGTSCDSSEQISEITSESLEASVEESLEASTEESTDESAEAAPEESTLPEQNEPEQNEPEQNEPEQNKPVINTPQSNGKANVVGKTLGAGGASQGDWIYYVEGNQFFKINQNTYKSETIFILPMGWASNLNVVGDWLYFSVPETTDESAYIGKVRIDGRDFQKIVYTNDVWEVLVIGETVYYTSTNNPYTVWAKDIAPLYSVSVNGGAVTQVHDGSVENLVADENYIYFQYREKAGGKRSFVRMNHNATSRQTLWINELAGTEIDSFGFVVSEGRIYFTERYDNSETYRTVSSISINGGDYVAHFRANLFSSSLWAKNGKIYFGGVAPEYRDGYIGEYGDLSLTEYDMASGRFTALYDEWQYFYPTNEMLVVPEMHALWLYDYDSKTFTKVLLYV